MATTEITVRGAYSAFLPPERGTVVATLGYEGPAMERVYEQLTGDLARVRASIEALHDPAAGPVTWWSAEQVRTWSERPWNKDGKQLPLVHKARVGMEVKFSDFAVLGRWVGERVEDTPGLRVGTVRWALTEARRDALAKDARTRAVRDAQERAQQYADALGLGMVRPVALADAGMLGEGLAPQGSGPVAYARAGAGGGTPDLQLVPEDIEVAARVDARFVAGR